jgi:hypothetical protein
MKKSAERIAAVVGAAALLAVGVDALSVAATGKGLILGHVNSANKTTTITNTGSGAVLNLHTKKSTSPPLTTNGTGQVKNLNASQVGGQTIKGFAKIVANGTTTQQTALSLNGLKLTLSCGTNEPTVQAIAGASGSLMRGTKIGIAATPAALVGTSNATANTPVTVFAPTDFRGSLVLHYLTTSGHRVDVNAVVDDTHTINNFDGCLLEGTAIAG